MINEASENVVEAIVDDGNVEEDCRTALLKLIQETNVRPRISPEKLKKKGRLLMMARLTRK